MELETVWVTVIPEPGLNKEVAQRLLAVAPHPYQVRTVTYPQFGYEVPADVYAAFEEQGPVEAGAAVPPKEFTDGDTDLVALKKRDSTRKNRKNAAIKADEREGKE